MEILHYCITITGTVQGVWYRKHCQEKALALGLAGYVCNKPDGSVYVEAEGPQEKLDELVSWCRKGPDQAIVKDVIIELKQPLGRVGFEIRR